MGSTHTLLTASVIAKEALMLLRNNMVMGARVHRAYENELPGNVNGYKKGQSISIQKPVKFKVTTGRTRSTSTISEQSITLTVSTQKHVSWAFNSLDLTMSIAKYSEKYIQPAAMVLANEVDFDLCALYKDVWNTVWESTGYVTPESFIVLGKAGQRMDEEAVPQNMRCIALNPAANWSLANALKGLYVESIAGPAVKKGYLATIAGLDIYMDQNINVHTTGNFHASGSTAAIAVGLSGGTGIPTTGAGYGTAGKTLTMINFRIVDTQVLKVGDVFTIAGVYAVNPVSGQSTGSLRQFVVTADASCGATETTSGNAVTVYVEPALVATGPYKTVDTFPAAGAEITIAGNQAEPYPQNIAFHKNAFALVMVPLAVPDGVSFAASASDNGMHIRVVKDYDIDLDDEVIRMDILYGVKTIYPELACRIMGMEG
jgi:hypothetical protein